MSAAVPVHAAAQLIYAADTTVSLASPATTFTIASGSVADTLTVNTNNVVVGISDADGGSFVLSSPQYGVTVGESAGGGSASVACAGNGANVTITQTSGSASYTITPTGAPCVTPSSVTVNVSSGYGVPYISGVGPVASSSASSSVPNAEYPSAATTSAASSSPASLLALLNTLKARLAVLEAQAGLSAQGTVSASSVFVRDLAAGMTGSDVNALQKYLIAENRGSAARALKAHGTTNYFGPLTKAALIEFQKSVGIRPAAGYFGPITRQWIAAH